MRSLEEYQLLGGYSFNFVRETSKRQCWYYSHSILDLVLKRIVLTKISWHSLSNFEQSWVKLVIINNFEVFKWNNQGHLVGLNKIHRDFGLKWHRWKIVDLSEIIKKFSGLKWKFQKVYRLQWINKKFLGLGKIGLSTCYKTVRLLRTYFVGLYKLLG